jgi:acyl-CoA synthetase (AMP-forming)/AMP-acid ligase II
VEEVLYASGLAAEAVALGVPHPLLGQAVVAVVKPEREEAFHTAELIAYCRRRLPGFMVPLQAVCRAALPRNPNGKFDRRQLLDELRGLFTDPPA